MRRRALPRQRQSHDRIGVVGRGDDLGVAVLPVDPAIVGPVGLNLYDSALGTRRQLSIDGARYPSKREQNGEEQFYRGNVPSGVTING
jgi:hypothetical protein